MRVAVLSVLLLAVPALAQEHQHHGHGHHGAPVAGDGQATEPLPPTDFAADRIFDPKIMAAARAASHAEHGAGVYSMARISLAEYQVLSATDSYRWEADAWYGGDIHRLVLKTEGEGEVRGPVEDAELQALYSRATGPYFNFQAGIRADFAPTPSRVYATIGMEGLAPYYIETLGALFLSNKGELLARLEASYDQLITRRLVIQPRAEMNLAATDIDARGIGKGVSTIEVGLRLRYEIKREFAPYIGLSYHRKIGHTADMARAAGERVGGTALVLGLSAWF